MKSFMDFVSGPEMGRVPKRNDLTFSRQGTLPWAAVRRRARVARSVERLEHDEATDERCAGGHLA
jgi:hypothetical protein